MMLNGDQSYGAGGMVGQEVGPGAASRPDLRSGLPWRTLVVSLIILGVTVLIYLGMIFGMQPYLEHQIAKQEGQLDQMTSSMSQNEQKAALNFYSQLYNISVLLKQRVDIMPFFAVLEAHTPGDITLTGATVDILRGQKAQLSGTALTPDAVVAMAAAMRSDTSTISGVSINTVSAPTQLAGGVAGAARGFTFSMDVSFFAKAFQTATH